jgi:hypothetical protein
VTIALDVIDLAVAALIGVSLMMVCGILNENDIAEALKTAGGPLALLFGGMVVARVLAKTGIFERVGAVFLRATGGSGKRYLLLLVLLVAPVCAFLPNATTVILLAPVIIKVAQALKVDFVGPMVLAAIISNSAGMLTLVGDPATFLVGSSDRPELRAVPAEGELGGIACGARHLARVAAADAGGVARPAAPCRRNRWPAASNGRGLPVLPRDSFVDGGAIPNRRRAAG